MDKKSKILFDTLGKEWAMVTRVLQVIEFLS
jgi:hypothetical protein